MSRQSLAVNSSGALIGHDARRRRCSPLTVSVMFSGPPGLTSRVLGGDLDLRRAGGQRLLGADLGPHDDEQVVLVTEVAVVEVAGEPAAGAAQRVEHAAGVLGKLGVDRDEVGAVAERRGAELGHPGDVAGRSSIRGTASRCAARGDRRGPRARRRSGRRCCGPPRSRTSPSSARASRASPRRGRWPATSPRRGCTARHSSSSGVQSCDARRQRRAPTAAAARSPRPSSRRGRSRGCP